MSADDRRKRFKPIARFNATNHVICAADVEAIINGVFQKMNAQPWRREQNTKIREITISDPTLFISAFTHKSYIYEMIEIEKNTGRKQFIPEKDYEVLEFLGDALLSFLIVNILVANFENENEHFLTILKIRLIKKEMYAQFSRTLGFERFVLISSFLESSKDQGRQSDSMLEDVFEAFFGAILKHFGTVEGIRIANDFITGIFEEQINFTKLIITPDNFKDCIIQHFRTLGWGSKPALEQLYQHGPPNDRTFGMALKLENRFIAQLSEQQNWKIQEYSKGCVSRIPLEHFNNDIQNRIAEINDSEYRIIGFGIARSKKKGEQLACEDALKILDVDPNFILMNGSQVKKRG